MYLAQPRPADNPQSFASGRLADPGTFTMDRVAFSLDGKEFYYTQSEACYSLKKAKTKVFKYDGHKWIGPTVLNEHHCGPTFSMDGKTLYFMGEKDNQVWMSRRTMKGWTIPALFLEKPYEHIDLMPTQSGTYYLASNSSAVRSIMSSAVPCDSFSGRLGLCPPPKRAKEGFTKNRTNCHFEHRQKREMVEKLLSCTKSADLYTSCESS